MMQSEQNETEPTEEVLDTESFDLEQELRDLYNYPGTGIKRFI